MLAEPRARSIDARDRAVSPSNRGAAADHAGKQIATRLEQRRVIVSSSETYVSARGAAGAAVRRRGAQSDAGGSRTPVAVIGSTTCRRRSDRDLGAECAGRLHGIDNASTGKCAGRGLNATLENRVIDAGLGGILKLGLGPGAAPELRRAEYQRHEDEGRDQREFDCREAAFIGPEVS